LISESNGTISGLDLLPCHKLKSSFSTIYSTIKDEETTIESFIHDKYNI